MCNNIQLVFLVAYLDAVRFVMFLHYFKKKLARTVSGLRHTCVFTLSSMENHAHNKPFAPGKHFNVSWILFIYEHLYCIRQMYAHFSYKLSLSKVCGVIKDYAGNDVWFSFVVKYARVTRSYIYSLCEGIQCFQALEHYYSISYVFQ